jgi:hypothetical protein
MIFLNNNLGMNWFKRLYVTSSSWENEQTIFQDEDKIRINGISKYFFC